MENNSTEMLHIPKGLLEAYIAERQTINNITIHRKQKIEQHEPFL